MTTTTITTAVWILAVGILTTGRSLLLVSGFPSGAPPDACSTNLMPIHGGHQASLDPPPYVVTASSGVYSPNKPITVVVKGVSGSTFKGFVVQAQEADTRRPITSGEWQGVDAVKELPCAAVTHTSPSAKSKVELTWTPKGSGHVIFVATVVESFDTFYADIKSTVRGSSGSSSSSSSIGSSSFGSHSLDQSSGNKASRPRPSSGGHSGNSAQNGDSSDVNFPGAESSFQGSATRPKDDDHHFDDPSNNNGPFFQQSFPNFGSSRPLHGGRPNFGVEHHGGGGGGGNPFGNPSRLRPPHFNPFHQQFSEDRQQQETSQIFSSFPAGIHRFAGPGHGPHGPPFPLRAPWPYPHQF